MSCGCGGRLGSGPLTAAIQTRGGGQNILSQIRSSDDEQVTMRLDGMGESSLFIPESCCDQIQRISRFEHELILSWGGHPFWVGPVVDLNHKFNGTELIARDLSWWFTVRLLSAQLHQGVDLVTIWADYFADAMAGDPSPNIGLQTTLLGATGDREVLDEELQYAWEALTEMARNGFDWTMVKRTLVVGPPASFGSGRIRLLDKHFGTPPEVNEVGGLQATEMRVYGGDTDQATNEIYVGVASDANAIAKYGLIQRAAEEEEIIDQASADSAAATRLSLRLDPVFIDLEKANTLTPDAPVCLHELICGAIVDFDSTSTCRPTSGEFQLQEVSVTGKGTVDVTLGPIGA